MDPALDRGADHTTWHGAKIVGQILVEDIPGRNPAPQVRVTVTTTGGEIIRGQGVDIASIKGDGCAGATSISRLTHRAYDAAPSSGNHDPIGTKRGRGTLDVEGEAETRD